MNQDLQFYPTPPELARRAWSLFQSTPVRVLEPSAGLGHLLAAGRDRFDMLSRRGQSRSVQIDVCEVNAEFHPHLESQGYNCVGYDFMEMNGLERYSHIIMNPPFAQGAAHVLRAWLGAYDAEIVAILNAETLKNPFSKDRELLCRLVRQHGEVEFLEGQFESADTLRKTSVEVALIRLQKSPHASTSGGDEEFSQSVLGGLSQDDRGFLESLGETGPDGTSSCNDGLGSDSALALTSERIRNEVRVFRRAVEAMRRAVVFRHEADRAATAIGATFAETLKHRGHAPDPQPEDPRGPKPNPSAQILKDVATEYDQLKDRAWNSVLQSSQVRCHLTTRAMSKLEKEFDQIKAKDFTVSNVYGFIAGLIGNAQSLLDEVKLGFFDSVVSHHSSNSIYYLGWKSNDRHRLGMKLKTSRIVLPGFEMSERFVGYTTRRRLMDFDKAMLVLDRKNSSVDTLASGLVEAVETAEIRAALLAGERVRTVYFDIRYYPGRTTMHFFPRRPDLIERLNLDVGRLRSWLYHDDSSISPEDNEPLASFAAAELIQPSKEIRLWNVLHQDDEDLHQRDRMAVTEASQEIASRLGQVSAATLARLVSETKAIMDGPQSGQASLQASLGQPDLLSLPVPV